MQDRIDRNRHGSDRRPSGASGRALALALIAGLLASAAPRALAQTTPDADVSPNTSVTERFYARRFDDGALRAGGFILAPTALLETAYIDNVFVNNTADPVDDFIVTVGAGLGLRSDWSRHGAAFEGAVRRNWYLDNDTETYTATSLAGSVWLDIGRASRFVVDGGYLDTVELRQELQTAQDAVEPVDFSEARIGGTLELRQTRFREDIGVRYVKTNFDDAVNAGGMIIDQDFRDQEFSSAFYRQYVRLRPAIEAFAQVEGWRRRFDQNQLPLAVDQDSDGYSITGGLALDINKVARGEVGVGYQEENFDSAAFADFGGLSGRAELEIFVSGLTTVNINAERAVAAAGIIGAGGFFANSASVSVDHELFRNVLLSAGMQYRLEEFRDFDRDDRLFGANIGATYLLGRNVALNAEYVYLTLESRGLDARNNFDQNIVRFSIELRR